MKSCRVSFLKSHFPPVELKEGEQFSEHLNAQNSPLLFGCRIGICGTCVIEIVSSQEELPPRTTEEVEYLEALAPERMNCRLACQLKASTDMTIKKTEI